MQQCMLLAGWLAGCTREGGLGSQLTVQAAGAAEAACQHANAWVLSAWPGLGEADPRRTLHNSTGRRRQAVQPLPGRLLRAMCNGLPHVGLIHLIVLAVLQLPLTRLALRVGLVAWGWE